MILLIRLIPKGLDKSLTKQTSHLVSTSSANPNKFQVSAKDNQVPVVIHTPRVVLQAETAQEAQRSDPSSCALDIAIIV